MKRKGHLAVFENILEENESNSEYDPNDCEDEKKAKPETKRIIRRITEEPIKFKCRYKDCEKEFDEYSLFDKHLIAHINPEDFADNIMNSYCEYGNACGLRYASFLHAIQHMSIHGYHDRLCYLGEIAIRRNSLPECKLGNVFTCPETEVAYICEWNDCNLQLDTIFNFLSHVKMHVNGNPSRDLVNKITCGWKGCGNQYNLLYKLTKHVVVHTKEKYLGCFVCGNTFASMPRFSDHRNRQLPIEKRNYVCSQCSKNFATESLLLDHVRHHINQYKCPMCDMTCSNSSHLTNHIRFRHLKERAYKCNLCQHTAISKQNLEQHLITHCVEKLLACEECDFRCRSLHTLDRHIQREHIQHIQLFECHICKKQFTRSFPLSKHLMAAHSVQRPSGHSRFRYKRDPDGICRLQTVRIETVNVIKEIMESKSRDKSGAEKKRFKCHIKRNEDMSIEVNIEDVSKPQDNDSNHSTKKRKLAKDIIMTISDLDDEGNVLTEVTETQELDEAESS